MTSDDVRRREANIRHVHRVLSDLARLDAAAVVEGTHATLRFELPFERGNPVLDRAAFTRLMAGITENFQRFALTPVETVECTDPDALIVRYEGDCLSRDGSVEYRNSYVGFFDLADGLISRWREYANPVLTRKMNESVGAVEL